MRENGTLTWLIADPLGSTSLTVDASGTLLSSLKYTAFGELRSGIAATDYGYTGQRNLDAQQSAYSLGLMDFKARFYSPLLGRFIQPDIIVPGAGNPQAFNRYSYGYNNPSRYIDPSGHIACMDGEYCGTSRILLSLLKIILPLFALGTPHSPKPTSTPASICVQDPTTTPTPGQRLIPGSTSTPTPIPTMPVSIKDIGIDIVEGYGNSVPPDLVYIVPGIPLTVAAGDFFMGIASVVKDQIANIPNPSQWTKSQWAYTILVVVIVAAVLIVK